LLFWDRIGSATDGVKQEERLKTVFFKELVAGGAQFMRYQRGNMEMGRINLRCCPRMLKIVVSRASSLWKSQPAKAKGNHNFKSLQIFNIQRQL